MIHFIFTVFRMTNLKLMTEEEREAYFNRPESLKARKPTFFSNLDVTFVFRKESPILEVIVTSPMLKALWEKFQVNTRFKNTRELKKITLNLLFRMDWKFE